MSSENVRTCHKCGLNVLKGDCPNGCNAVFKIVVNVPVEHVAITEFLSRTTEKRSEQIKKHPIHFFIGVSLFFVGFAIMQIDHPISHLLVLIIEILGVASLPINVRREIIIRDTR